MEQENRKPRLDEILVNEGLVSESEIKEALLRQKAYGGKFGSQLLYHRYINESGLVRALATQFDCDGVVLSDLEIPEILIQMVPEKVAIARKAIPFDYDTENDILRIACEDPNDQNLKNELCFVCRRKQIELFVAAELALNTAIAKYYLKRDISLDDNLLFEIPDSATGSGKIPISAEEEENTELQDNRPVVLLVTKEVYSAPLIRSLLERDDFRVFDAHSVENALALLEERRFVKVLIHNDISEDSKEISDRLRLISPATEVQFYDNPSSLILGSDLRVEDDLLLKNLELFTSLLTSKEKLPINHSGRVGNYVNRLCLKLKLPDGDRRLISNAGYVHDLARFYYNSEGNVDNRHIINLTIRLFASLDYSTAVQDMLSAMYIGLEDKSPSRLPLKILAGNILTIVDLFCDSVPYHNRLSLDMFDGIKKKLRDQTGRVFLPEVVEAFIEMIQEDILDHSTSQKSGQVMIYSDNAPIQKILELRLKNEGYRTLSHNSAEAFIRLYKRREPDLMILIVSGKPDSILVSMAELADGDVSFKRTPSFLLTDDTAIPHLTGLLEQGIEDIVSIDDNLDLLVTKIGKLRARQVAQSETDADATASGAHGRLADMNLIDLIQALGPGHKTVKITVRSNGSDSDELVIHLTDGRICHAVVKDIEGVKAIYEGLTWAEGTWTVYPVTAEDLPDSNIKQSNESILMEGCRLLDERVKSGHLL
ncbi:MAG: DUF4388 domain-containing protein [FCB group bacterium]|nr:DUF4388 domain-containing protein [FCB group bacterium]